MSNMRTDCLYILTDNALIFWNSITEIIVWLRPKKKRRRGARRNDDYDLLSYYRITQKLLERKLLIRDFNINELSFEASSLIA